MVLRPINNCEAEKQDPLWNRIVGTGIQTAESSALVMRIQTTKILNTRIQTAESLARETTDHNALHQNHSHEKPQQKIIGMRI